MNVLDGLKIIRERLYDNDAATETLALVDAIMKRAALPAAQPATATSLLQLARMLARSPAANNNMRVYNDLLQLEEQLESAGASYRERTAAEEATTEAKSKKYYKQLKEKEEAKKQQRR